MAFQATSNVDFSIESLMFTAKKTFKDNEDLLYNKSNIDDTLNALNIKSVNLANNHILDYGKSALQNTINYLTIFS